MGCTYNLNARSEQALFTSHPLITDCKLFSALAQYHTHGNCWKVAVTEGGHLYTLLRRTLRRDGGPAA